MGKRGCRGHKNHHKMLEEHELCIARQTAWNETFAKVREELTARSGWDQAAITQARWDTSLILWQEHFGGGDWTGGLAPGEPSSKARPIAEGLGLWPPSILLQRSPFQPSLPQGSAQPFEVQEQGSIAPLPSDQWMLNQMYQNPVMHSGPHYTQDLEQATNDFQNLILARNPRRVSKALNPHANEFQAPQIIVQAPKDTIIQAPQSAVPLSNNTMIDVADRIKRLEGEVKELKMALQEHLSKCICTSENNNLGEKVLGEQVVGDGTAGVLEPVRTTTWETREMDDDADSEDLIQL